PQNMQAQPFSSSRPAEKKPSSDARGANRSSATTGLLAAERRQHGKAAWLWSQRLPIIGSIAETYLREARGYHREIIPATLGFLAPAKPGHHPALIAAFGK